MSAIWPSDELMLCWLLSHLKSQLTSGFFCQRATQNASTVAKLLNPSAFYYLDSPKATTSTTQEAD